MTNKISEHSDFIVYNFLVENGHVKTARKFLEERKICTSFSVSLKLSDVISEYYASGIVNLKVNQASILSNTIVYKYLNEHEKPEVQKLAQKMADEVPIQLE